MVSMEDTVVQAVEKPKGLGSADKQFILIGAVLLILIVVVYLSVISGGA